MLLAEGCEDKLECECDIEEDKDPYKLVKKLTKTHERLLALDKRKQFIQQKLDKSEEKLCKIDSKLMESEMRASRAKEEEIVRDLQVQLWQEINDLKRKKKTAEKELQEYRKLLTRKLVDVKKITLGRKRTKRLKMSL